MTTMLSKFIKNDTNSIFIIRRAMKKLKKIVKEKNKQQTINIF